VSIDIQGVCPDRFAAVREAFAANFAEGRELGAAFAVRLDGEPVIDLRAGHADRARTRPFAEDTLTPVFSTTKAVAALVIARAVDEGLLDYEQTVASLWPEFAQAGKARLTVAEALSHQAGLSGLTEPMDPADWYDWDGVCARLGAMAPLWPPGEGSGYHPVTWGYLAGEIFHRATGRSLGRALAEDFAGPFGLDLWIGLPDAEHGRAAELQRPGAMPDLGPLTEAKRAAFLTPWASPGGRASADWRRAEIPSVNGHATAPALAKLMSLVACGGRLDGRQMLSPATLEALTRERTAGEDRVLPYRLSWAAGLTRTSAPGWPFGPGARSVGHYGWGGSCAFADPDARISGAYVLTRQSTELVGDARPLRLIEALYRSL